MQSSPVFWIDNLSKIIGQQYKQTAKTDVTSAPYIHRNTTVIGMRKLPAELDVHEVVFAPYEDWYMKHFVGMKQHWRNCLFDPCNTSIPDFIPGSERFATEEPTWLLKSFFREHGHITSPSDMWYDPDI